MIRSNRSVGFTLIETLIVASIIGILSSAALPAYDMYTQRTAFREAILQVTVYRNLLVVAAETGRIDSLDDMDEGQFGIPNAQWRSETSHGIHIHDGEIKITWRKDGSALEGTNYTLTAQSHVTPIQWVAGGNCFWRGYC